MLTRCLLAAASLAALTLAACSSPEAASPPAADAARAKPTLTAARDMQYTETFEVRFTNELVGYMVDVLPAPAGLPDQRAYPPGTKLIQDKDFQFIGFISPHGTTYRFDPKDPDAAPKTVGIGSVEQGIAAFFRRNGPPTLVSISPGTKPAN